MVFKFQKALIRISGTIRRTSDAVENGVASVAHLSKITYCQSEQSEVRARAQSGVFVLVQCARGPQTYIPPEQPAAHRLNLPCSWNIFCMYLGQKQNLECVKGKQIQNNSCRKKYVEIGLTGHNLRRDPTTIHHCPDASSQKVVETFFSFLPIILPTAAYCNIRRRESPQKTLEEEGVTGSSCEIIGLGEI